MAMDLKVPFVMRTNNLARHRGEELPANVILFSYDKESQNVFMFHSTYNEDKLVLWRMSSMMAGFHEKMLTVPYPSDDLLDYAAADNRAGQFLLHTSYFDFMPKCGRIRVWQKGGSDYMEEVASQAVNPLPNRISFGPTKRWIFGMHTPRDTRPVYGFRSYLPGDEFPPFDKELTVRLFGDKFKDVPKPTRRVGGAVAWPEEERDSAGSLPGDPNYGMNKPDVMKMVDCTEEFGILIRAKSNDKLEVMFMQYYLFTEEGKKWVDMGDVTKESQKYLLSCTTFLDKDTNALYGLEKIKKEGDKYGEEPEMVKCVKLEYDQPGCPISTVKLFEDDYERILMDKDRLLIRDGILFSVSHKEGTLAARYLRLPTMKEEAQINAQKMYGKSTDSGVLYEAFTNKKFREKTGCKGASVFPWNM